MKDDRDDTDYTVHERRLLDSLPRVLETRAGDEAPVIQALRAEGLLQPRIAPRRWRLLIAAGIALFALGGFAGSRVGIRMAERRSLEGMLERNDLSLAERVLLMQRSGTAYVRAAHSYAAAAKGIDSMAVQVASQVLIGAAKAVARSDLDGGLSEPLAALLQQNPAQRAIHPVIWY